jgi:hypothetical protein
MRLPWHGMANALLLLWVVSLACQRWGIPS